MSCKLQPQEFYAPGWHSEARTPVVDHKYYDRTTGEVLTASGHEEYQGPPAVDIIIKSLHAETAYCSMRAALAFPMEVLLCQITRVIGERKLNIDSLTATPYAIRLIIAHEMTKAQFFEIAAEMTRMVSSPKMGADDGVPRKGME